MSDPAHPHPDFRARFDAGALIGAAALVGFGVSLWVAANWDHLDKFGRFGLVGAVLALAGLAAIVASRLRGPASLIGLMATGALLALFGQTYQSGADPWQLFALWAALTAPWALAARHDAVWSAWAVVAMTAIGLWTRDGGGRWSFQPDTMIAGWAMAAALCLALAPWPRADAALGARGWALRVAATLTLAMIAGGGIEALFVSRASLHVFWIGLALLAGAVVALAWRRPLDLALLALATLALDATLIAGLARGLFMERGAIGSMLAIGLAAAGVVAASAAGVLRVARGAGALAPAGAAAADGRAAWPVIALTGIGALIATIPLLIFFGLAFGSFVMKGAGLLFIGPAVIVAAVSAIRLGAPLGFLQQLGAIGLVLGMTATTIGLFKDFPPRPAALAMLAVCVGLAAALRVGWISILLGAGAAGMAAILTATTSRLTDVVGAAYLSQGAMLVGLAGATALAVLSREGDDNDSAGWRDAALAFVSGWLVAALAMAATSVGQTYLLAGATPNPLGAGAMAGWAANQPFLQIAGVGAALAASGWLAWRMPALRHATGLALAALTTTLAFVMPMLGVATAILAAAIVAGRRVLALAAGFAALWILGAFYYALNLRLIDKAWLLVGLGLALGIVVLASGWRPGRAASAGGRPAGGRFAPLLIAASLLVTGASVGSGIRAREAVLREGRVIWLALAPVDPRSLTQGDYMALRFALPGGRRLVEAGETDLRAIASLDARGIATVTRFADAATRAGDGEIALRLARRNNEWTVGTDAFFFREGEAAKYEKARFGQFRVDGDGRAVLVGLADADLNPL
jgi:uncharacterized membrane-anchored protein